MGVDNNKSGAILTTYLYAHLPGQPIINVGNPPNGPGIVKATWQTTVSGNLTGEFNGTSGIPVTTLEKLDFGFKTSLSVSVSSALGITADVPPGYVVFPCVRVTYNRVNKLIDHYDTHGFHDEGSVTYSTNWQVTPFFSQLVKWDKPIPPYNEYVWIVK